jgi:hypothetical protein
VGRNLRLEYYGNATRSRGVHVREDGLVTAHAHYGVTERCNCLRDVGPHQFCHVHCEEVWAGTAQSV